MTLQKRQLEAERYARKAAKAKQIFKREVLPKQRAIRQSIVGNQELLARLDALAEEIEKIRLELKNKTVE